AGQFTLTNGVEVVLNRAYPGVCAWMIQKRPQGGNNEIEIGSQGEHEQDSQEYAPELRFPAPIVDEKGEHEHQEEGVEVELIDPGSLRPGCAPCDERVQPGEADTVNCLVDGVVRGGPDQRYP